MSKIGLILLSVAVLVLLALSVYFKVELDRATDSLATAEGNLDKEQDARRVAQVSADKIIAEKEVQIRDLEKSKREFDRATEDAKRFERALEDEKGKTAEEKKRADTAAAEVEQYRVDRDKARQELANQIKVHEDLLPQLAEAKQAREDTAHRLTETLKERDGLQAQLAQAQSENAKLKEEVGKLQSLAPELAGNQIMGKVEEKVGAEKIIISELSDKPEVGLELSVFRENEFIARARVYRVFEKYAGARITFLQKDREVTAGDIVKTGF